jgi:hypothetical protein
MVNVGFPPTVRYGFEMVDAPDASKHGKISHQSKIYSESISQVFSRIFESLNSMQTLAIYRRLVVQGTDCEINRNGMKNRRPGSRDVFSAAHGVLARARARAAAEG